MSGLMLNTNILSYEYKNDLKNLIMVDDKLKKIIPTLRGTVAERFEKQAHTNEVNRASVDYTEQVESMRAILEESTKGE